MAILEKLRTKAGLLLAIAIGFALFLFVLSDFLNSSGSLFNKSKNEIAEVFGKSVPYSDYETEVKKFEDIQKYRTRQMSLDEETTDQIRSATWENMIHDLILSKQYDKLGIDVGKDELNDLIQGNNPHPIIQQMCTDPRTGVFNRQLVQMFVQKLQEEEDSPEKNYYTFIVDEIIREQKYSKYLNLVRKGLYITKLEAKLKQEESSKTADVNYIAQNFNSISDSAISVSNSDLKKYYEENKNKYKQKESRDIRYVYYQVVPSETDYKAAKQWIDDIKPDFEKAEDITQFVDMESDVPFDAKNYKMGELPDTLNNIMFSSPKGTMYGPYFIDNSYRLARLEAINYLPDSVKARHILLQGSQNPEATHKLADSLKTVIKKGANFAELALKYSSDQGSAQKGGDLGWFKQDAMIQPFSDSCFYGRKGDVKIVETQYGIHIIQILDQSKPVKHVQVGILIKNIMPSSTTDQYYYNKANEFAGMNNTYEKFIKASEGQIQEGKSQIARNVDPMEKNIQELGSARELVTWAYRTKEHDVSQVLKIGNNYVVAAVDKVRKEGYTPMEDIKADLENKVKQQKKAEKISAMLESKLDNAKTIEELARNTGLQAQFANNLMFSSPNLGNAGIEPDVVATALVLKKGEISDPIIGENGVYMIEVNNINEPPKADLNNLATVQGYLQRNFDYIASNSAYEALKEIAKIKDNRRLFF